MLLKMFNLKTTDDKGHYKLSQQTSSPSSHTVRQLYTNYIDILVEAPNPCQQEAQPSQQHLGA